MEKCNVSCFITQQQNAIPIEIVIQTNYVNWLTTQTDIVKHWLASNQFRGEGGNVCQIPDASGKIQKILCCIADAKNLWSVGHLPTSLPEGNYFFTGEISTYQSFAIAWGLGAYQFAQYKKALRQPAQLFLPPECEPNHIINIVESIYLVRDLINMPTNELGPTELATSATQLSQAFNATCQHIVGEDLLKQNYPAIHAVGRASDDAPRLIDLRWGNKKHPKMTLVGKGVCFDSGGLDIKPSSAMLLMKKDMGGAAHVLGLARMIMQAELPVCLRVLIPAVENAISGNAYRPGDIIQSRKGITIEIGNTDAEGRVVLADALTEAVSERPDLIIDIATLTGAARVALGTDLPALFTNQEELARIVMEHAKRENDPVWQLPLFTAYRESLNSTIADINNASMDSYAGAITAALFLKEFVPDEIPWLHFDLMAWNMKTRPGRPQGGEAMALRALFSFLKGRVI